MVTCVDPIDSFYDFCVAGVLLLTKDPVLFFINVNIKNLLDEILCFVLEGSTCPIVTQNVEIENWLCFFCSLSIQTTQNA